MKRVAHGQALMLRGESELGEPWGKQLALGLGLVFLGKQGAIEATLEVTPPPVHITMLTPGMHQVSVIAKASERAPVLRPVW